MKNRAVMMSRLSLVSMYLLLIAVSAQEMIETTGSSRNSLLLDKRDDSEVLNQRRAPASVANSEGGADGGIHPEFENLSSDSVIKQRVEDKESDNDKNMNDNETSSHSATNPSSTKRLWGASSAASSESTPIATDSSQQSVPKAESSSSSSSLSSTSKSSTTPTSFDKTLATPPSSQLSFVTKSKTLHPPPEGFVISARVYIDGSDKLAHVEEDAMTLPYFDCGVMGSTTAPLSVKDATFRHSLTPTNSWTMTESSTSSNKAAADGTHPLVAVALSPLVLETNSGESKSIQPGQAILLEDGLSPGHKMVPVSHHEIQVLFLTLRQTHIHPGKERVSLPRSTATSTVDPCPLPNVNGDSRLQLLRRQNMVSNILRRGLFGLTGLSFSTLMVDFLSKTAPLWLAVGVGGICFVTAGTLLAVWAGERTLVHIEVWLEQRQLQTGTTTSSTVLDEETVHASPKRSSKSTNSSQEKIVDTTERSV